MNQDESHRFHTTRWSLVQQVRDDRGTIREEALETLLRMYEPALRSLLTRQHRLSVGDAEECVQEFIVEKVLVQDLLARADANRGRLRSFLAKSLDNFAKNWMRKNRSRTSSIEAADDAFDEPVGTDAFDAAWARTLLIVAIQKMRSECESATSLDEWGLLKHRLLVPIFFDQKPSAMDALAERYGLPSAVVASNKLVTAKRRLARIVRQLILESVNQESEVDDEISALFRALRAEGRSTGEHESHAESEGWAIILESADGESLSRLLDSTRDRDS